MQRNHGFICTLMEMAEAREGVLPKDMFRRKR